MSIRSDIINSLVTALETITTDNGYNTNVKKVAKFVLSYDQAKELSPCLSVIEREETVRSQDETNVLYILSVGIAGYVKGTQLPDISTAATGLIDDLKKVIYAPLNLGDYCRAVNLTSTDMDVYSVPEVGSTGMILEIIYYSPKAGV